jgi:CRP/FNR family transcriptional regulator, polysaccharide utilization system transcription regulator
MMTISRIYGLGRCSRDNFVLLKSINLKKKTLNSGKEAFDCDVSHQSIFKCLTPVELELFDQHKLCLFFQKGQPIFHEGSYPLGIFCIESGKVKLEHSGDEGKMQIVRMAKAGDIIGYRALFCDEKYNATAVALEDANTCFIPKDTFLNVLHTSNKLATRMINILAVDLRKAEEHLTELAQKPVRERMAKALLFLKETYGLEEDNATINVLLTREELADLVGTATETTIRLLSDFKSEGIIEFAGKKIKISNPAKLNKTAHYYERELSFY